MTDVRSLADEVFDYELEINSFLRVRHGLPVTSLRAESDESWRKDAEFARRTLATLNELPAEDDPATRGFLEHVLNGWVDRVEHEHLGFTVTPYQSFFLGMGLQHVFQNYSGAPENYDGLVADYRDQVSETRARLLRQREAGILLPRPAIPGVRESLSRSRSAAAAVLTGPVATEVDSAYDELLACFDDGYFAAAPSTVGFAQWDGGADYYGTLLRHHTASTMTPEQVHELGLAQVAELADKMAKVRADLGFAGTEEEFHAQLATDPRVHASDPAEVEALFLRHMAALEPLIGKWFSTLPKAPYGVERLDLELEAGMTYGYYEVPTPTTPIGRYRWNGSKLETKSLLTYAALIFHELAPGHHFHIARQSENETLPRVRRDSMDIGAFNEGWAEYAAGLGWEMGLYSEPLDAYGRLVHERFTAQRLVVDTGLNAFGWSLEKAAAYMKANTTDSDGQIATEVLRYSTDLPGQALAYRAGFIELNRIRSKAEAALGAAFDIRDFHEQILGPGALPFPTIEATVDRWIAQVS